jgi:ABC-type transporter Mla maintaining outer membrane lipid asymmetry permease subunit MlaE
MDNPIALVGYKALQFVQQLGKMAVFAGAIARAIVTPPMRFRAFWHEMYKIGVLSLIIIGVCGVAVGMVCGAVQGVLA